MKQCIREELKYLLKTKNIIIFIIINAMICGSMLYSNYNIAKMYISDYIYCKESFEQGIEAGIVDEAGTLIVEDGDDVQYVKENAEFYIYAASPKYTVELGMVASISMSILVLALFVILLIGNDNSNNILRIKSVRHNRRDIYWAKSIVYYITSVLIILASIEVVYIFNKIYYPLFMKKHDKFNDLNVMDMSVNDNWIMKIVFILIVIALSIEIGMFIVLSIKKSTLAVVAIIVYSMIIPKFGTLDIRCCLGSLLANYYDCYGAITVDGADSSNIVFSFGFTLVVLVMLKSVNYLLYTKRSAY